MGSKPIEGKFGGVADGLVLVYGGASWGWSRVSLGLAAVMALLKPTWVV